MPTALDHEQDEANKQLHLKLKIAKEEIMVSELPRKLESVKSMHEHDGAL